VIGLILVPGSLTSASGSRQWKDPTAGFSRSGSVGAPETLYVPMVVSEEDHRCRVGHGQSLPVWSRVSPGRAGDPPARFIYDSAVQAMSQGRLQNPRNRHQRSRTWDRLTTFCLP